MSGSSLVALLGIVFIEVAFLSQARLEPGCCYASLLLVGLAFRHVTAQLIGLFMGPWHGVGNISERITPVVARPLFSRW